MDYRNIIALKWPMRTMAIQVTMTFCSLSASLLVQNKKNIIMNIISRKPVQIILRKNSEIARIHLSNKC